MTISHFTRNSIYVDSVPVGVITGHAGSSAPSGWIFCDGSQILIADYRQLYNVLTNGGTTFPYGTNTNGLGVAGVTHFQLPNLTDRYVCHQTASIGTTGGSLTHSHSFTTAVSIANAASGGHNHTTNTLNTLGTNYTTDNAAHNNNTETLSATTNTLALVGGNSQITLPVTTHTHSFTVTPANSSALAHIHNVGNYNFVASANHETDHIPNANISSFVNQVTYQSPDIQEKSNEHSNSKIRAIIKT